MKIVDEVFKIIIMMLMLIQVKCKIIMWLTQNWNVNAYDFKYQSMNSQIINLLNQENKENKERRWFTCITT